MKDFSPDVGYMAGHALLLAETVICSNDEMALAAYTFQLGSVWLAKTQGGEHTDINSSHVNGLTHAHEPSSSGKLKPVELSSH
jgi:hypothetical protein